MYLRLYSSSFLALVVYETTEGEVEETLTVVLFGVLMATGVSVYDAFELLLLEL